MNESQPHLSISSYLSRLRQLHPLEIINVLQSAMSTFKYRYIYRCAKSGTIVGQRTQIINFSRVEIGKDCLLQDNVYMRAGATGSIRLGNCVAINSYAKLFGHGGITVEDYAQLGPGTLLTTTSHDIERRMAASFRPIVICEWAWIGANSTILSGVTIGSHSVIGAGSVVTKDIPEYSIAVGAPARVIKEIPKQDSTD